MDDVLVAYFAASNERDPDERRRLLEQSLTSDAELLDLTGCWRGPDGLNQRIANYHAAAPGTRVLPASGIDSHNNVCRYTWKITDRDGLDIMDGLDVATRAGDGRLQRILMFHGPIPP
jgi:hypothetical protein